MNRHSAIRLFLAGATFAGLALGNVYAQSANSPAASSHSFAQVGGGTHPGSSDPHRHDDWLRTDECKKVYEACKKLGFYDGGSQHNEGIWMDCFEKLVSRHGPLTKNGKPVTADVSEKDTRQCHANIYPPR